MGNIDLESGIGGIFNNYFPIVLGVLVLANLFDIYGKILGGLGLSSFKFTENFNDDKIDEGRRLLQAGIIYCKEKSCEQILIFLEKTNIELRYRTKGNKRGDSYVAINDSDSDRRSNSYSQSPTRHHDSFSSLWFQGTLICHFELMMLLYTCKSVYSLVSHNMHRDLMIMVR